MIKLGDNIEKISENVIEIFNWRKKSNHPKPSRYRSYKRRWFILAMFASFSAINAAQWTQYSIIQDIVTAYYGVSSLSVSWTSMIYMVTYVIFLIPASWMQKKYGLRVTVIIGAFGTCLGSWIKVFSTSQNGFWIGFAGQTIVACSQVCVLNVPPRLAALWFGPNQVSSACSIGVFGNQLGIALGFVLPPLLVQQSTNPETTGKELQLMFYLVAGITTVLLVIILLFFKAAPATPPSAAAELGASQEKDFGASIKSLFTNRNYILLILSYGINVGCFYAISTLLNQVILMHFPGANVHAGNIGLSIVCAGMAGSVVCGLILDKTHKFKETTLVVYIMSVVGMVVFAVTLRLNHIAIVYIGAIALGFFMTGYLPVGFEFASEITYPEPEGTTSGILNGVVQIFGIALTNAYDQMLANFGDIWANGGLTGLLVVGAVITLAIRADLRRQAAMGKG